MPQTIHYTTNDNSSNPSDFIGFSSKIAMEAAIAGAKKILKILEAAKKDGDQLLPGDLGTTQTQKLSSFI
jgi:hypothetical protein